MTAVLTRVQAIAWRAMAPLVGLALAACPAAADRPRQDSADRPAQTTAPSGSAPVAKRPPDIVLYDEQDPHSGQSVVVRRNLVRDAHERVYGPTNKHTTVAILASRGEPVIAVTTDRRPDLGGDDFAADPVLRLYRADGSELADLGSGRDPVVSLDGTRIAWAAPRGIAPCNYDEDASCARPARVVVADLEQPAEHRVASEEVSDLRGVAWLTKDEVVLQTDAGYFRADINRRTMTELPVEGRFAGGVPDGVGGWLEVAEGTVRRRDARGRAVWERAAPGWQADAFPAPTRTHAVVQLTRPDGSGGAEAQLLLVSLADRAEVQLPERRPDGNVAWSADGEWFSYRRLIENDSAFQLVVCARDEPTRCDAGFTWKAGIWIGALVAHDDRAETEGAD